VTGTFAFKSFDIPTDLAILTGGGEETWEGISAAHMAAYARYAPIRSGHHVLEVGCGVGRDAIPLISVLGEDGSYRGVDVSERSIVWCQENITRRHANFRFDHLNIQSEFYNPQGTLSASGVRLPVANGSIDRIILQSVFTHMFEPDITHFLREFRRTLRDNGRVFASFFVLGKESMRLAMTTPDVLTFRHPHQSGCRVNDPDQPEAAVGYTPKALARMLRRSGFEFDQPLHVGSWCGRRGVDDGQDIAILKPTRRITLRRGRPAS
jgi:ubiquinone/menaquinone biosynthesis C-methylase UbiE